MNETLRMLGIDNIESKFGLDKKRLDTEKKLARISKPAEYVQEAQEAFDKIASKDILEEIAALEILAALTMLEITEGNVLTGSFEIIVGATGTCSVIASG